MRAYCSIAFVLIQFLCIQFLFGQQVCIECGGTGLCKNCSGTGISGYRNCNGLSQSLGCLSCGGLQGSSCTESGSPGSGICSTCKGINKTKKDYAREWEEKGDRAVPHWDEQIECYNKALSFSPGNKEIEKKLKEVKHLKQIDELAKKSQLSQENLNRRMDSIRRADEAYTNQKRRIDSLHSSRQNKSPVNPPVNNISGNGHVTARASIEAKLRDTYNTEVPLPPWESTLSYEIENIRSRGHIKQTSDISAVMTDAFMFTFDMVTTASTSRQYAFKAIVIAGTSLSAAADEANIYVFKRNALYERALTLLKDKEQGPKLVYAIRMLRNKEPFRYQKVDIELIRIANAIITPELGSSSLRVTMSALLSDEAKAAFINTALQKCQEELEGYILELTGRTVSNRFEALRKINEQIEEGHRYLEFEEEPLNRSVVEAWIERLEKRMWEFEKVPIGVHEIIRKFQESEK